MRRNITEEVAFNYLIQKNHLDILTIPSQMLRMKLPALSCNYGPFRNLLRLHDKYIHHQ